jgi:hypothetical protein
MSNVKELHEEKLPCSTRPINKNSPCYSDTNIEKFLGTEVEPNLLFRFVHSSLVSY